MTFYLFLFGLLVIIVLPCFYGDYTKNKQVKANTEVMLYVFSILLIFLGGFRWEKGTDWDGYFSFFKNLSLSKNPFDASWFQFEVGYILLTFLIKSIYNSYTLFLLIFHSLIIFFTIKTIKKLSASFPLSFFLYFCATKGNIFAVRMNLAAAILFFSTIYIIKKDKVAFIFSIFFACTIHLSSIVFIIAYPLYYYKLSKKLLVPLWCISVFLAFNTKFAVNLILTPILNQIGTGRIVLKLLGYSDETTNNIFFILIYIVRYSIFIPVILYFCRTKDNMTSGFFNLYFFGSLFFIIFSTYLTQIQRAAGYFTRYEWFLLPIVFTKISRKQNKILFLIVILMYGFYKYYASFSANEWYDLFVPYTSVFTD
jgi:hypothetical protein